MDLTQVVKQNDSNKLKTSPLSKEDLETAKCDTGEEKASLHIFATGPGAQPKAVN